MIRTCFYSAAIMLVAVSSVLAQEPREIVAEVDGEKISAQDLRDAAGVSLAKLDAAANARARGNCNTAANDYSAFIDELTAQKGKGVDSTAADIMIADAQYLITHCP